MPVPIPQETDPFAEPGKWVFVNIEWIPIVLGTLSYALDDRYWTGSQTEASGVIQSVLQLIDGIGALLPPETVNEIQKVVYQLAESEPDETDDECDGDNMCKCPNSVHYDVVAKAFYYLDLNCNRVPIAAAAVSGDFAPVGEETTPDVPDVMSDFEEYLQNTEALKCSKATALVNEMWNVVGIHEGFDEVTGLFATIAFFAAAIATIAGAAGAAAVAASATSIGVSFTDLIASIGLAQLKEKLVAITDNEEAKAELICDLVSRMTINPSISDVATLTANRTSIYDADVKIAIERFAELVPESEEAVLLLKAFPVKSWKEVVTPKIAGTACGCADFLPRGAPDMSLPEAGCIKVMPVTSVRAIWVNTLMGGVTPQEALDNATTGSADPFGIKVSETYYTFGEFIDNGGGSDMYGVGIVITIPAGTYMDNIKFFFAGTGVATADWDIELWMSETLNGDMTQLITRSHDNDASISDEGTFEQAFLASPSYLYLSVQCAVPNDSAAPVFRVTSVAMSINDNDNLFVQLAQPGVTYC